MAIPYLRNWLYHSINLVELAHNLGHYFGRAPPLYSQRRPNPNHSPSPSSSAVFANNPSFGAANNPSIGAHSTAVRPIIPPCAFPQSPYGSGSGSATMMDYPSEVYKQNAINKLAENLHSDIVGLRKAREADMDGMFNVEAAFKQRDQYLRSVRLLSREQFFQCATSSKVRVDQMQAEVANMASKVLETGSLIEKVQSCRVMRNSIYFSKVRFYGRRCISYSLDHDMYYPRKQWYDW